MFERIKLEILTTIGEPAVRAQRLSDKKVCIGLFIWLLKKSTDAGLSLESVNWQVFISYL